MQAVVVSIINLKGGVAKTTTTVQLAECLASKFNKRVLVIDLDPQTNATVALIGEARWTQLDDAGQTVAQLFIDKLERTAVFNPAKAIQTKVSNLNLESLSLLASSVKLIGIQDRIKDIADKSRHTVDPMSVLKLAIKDILHRFDYVLIDCPPNLGYITQNGIEVSDYYFVPTIPDKLSTYGVPQIIGQIHEFKTERSLPIECLGIVWTKCDSRSSAHASVRQHYPDKLNADLAAKKLPTAYFFESFVPFANNFAEAVDYGRVPSRFSEKWGSSLSAGQKLFQHLEDLAREFMLYAVR